MLKVGVIALLALLPVAAGGTIPVPFRGIWAPSLADCRDEDGVNWLAIEGTGFSFYEDRSDPRNLQVDTLSPRRIRVRTTVSDNDNERSAVTMDFALSDRGRALAWSGFGRDPKKTDHYVRCKR